MAIDLQGSRFYMQQIACGARKQSRLKADIIRDIEELITIKLTSLIKVTNKDLEAIYDSLRLQKG
jgi:hypothetical protein